jgi:hypothetical protein
MLATKTQTRVGDVTARTNMHSVVHVGSNTRDNMTASTRTAAAIRVNEDQIRLKARWMLVFIGIQGVCDGFESVLRRGTHGMCRR